MADPLRTPGSPKGPLPVAPTEEAWRAMSPADRERFLIQVNDALSYRRTGMVASLEAKAEQAEAKLKRAVLSTRDTLLAILAARGLSGVDDARARATTCDDLELLQRWVV